MKMTAVEHFKYCPYCRAELGKYQQYTRTCPECQAVIYENVAATSGIMLLNDDHHVLVSRRGVEPNKGAYGLIGGFVEPGETALATALRELGEETGLQPEDVELLDFVGSFWDQDGEGGSHTLNLLYAGRLLSGEPKPGDDVAALEWYDIFHLPMTAFADSLKNTREALTALQDWYEAGGRERLG
jgi:ADP-ribose pyrophosphatase YjhB (NUDIX family)